jgi:hypothetical protein
MVSTAHARSHPYRHLTDYSAFVALLRQRKDELGLSNMQPDAIAGFCEGYVDKLIGPAGTTGTGPATFGPLLDALGLSGTLYADPAKAARVAGRWDKRRAGSGHPPPHIAKAAVARVRPVVLAELAARGAAKRWAGATPGQRQAVGRFLVEQRRQTCGIGESILSGPACKRPPRFPGADFLFGRLRIPVLDSMQGEK